MEIKRVAVIGLGTLGAQIAMISADNGYEVTGFDQDDSAMEKYLQCLPDPESVDKPKNMIDTSSWFESVHQIKKTDSLTSAVSDSDLVIEAVPENLALKQKVWAELDKAAPAHTILATNSSSMPVSRLEGSTKRAEKCINMHFYQPVMGMNMVDLMGGSQTTEAVIDAGRKFLISIGMVPISVNKELLGFCFNRVWRAIKKEALHMWAGGFVDHRDIDRAYMIFNKTSLAPFALMDVVGLDVVYDIEMVYFNESGDKSDHPPRALKEKIEAGELGVKTSKGFYTYPDPEFRSKDFLKP